MHSVTVLVLPLCAFLGKPSVHNNEAKMHIFTRFVPEKGVRNLISEFLYETG